MDQEIIEPLITNNGISIYVSDIENAIAAACNKLGIEDLTAEGQRRWKAVLKIAGSIVFNPDTKIVLKNKTYNNIYINNNIPDNSNLKKSDNNRYDYNIINILCDFYLLLSDMYNKLVSLDAFTNLLNIDISTVCMWKDREPSSTEFEIYQKLFVNRESNLKDKCFDSNNVIGTISIGNTEYNWNMPGVRTQTNTSATAAITDARSQFAQFQIGQKSTSDGQ